MLNFLARASLIFSLLVTFSAALGIDQTCGYHVYSSAAELVYEPCDESVDFYECYCLNPVARGTVALGIVDYCSGSLGEWRNAEYYCREDGHFTFGDFDAVLANAAVYQQPWPTDLTATVYAPVHIDPEFFKLLYRTDYDFYLNIDTAQVAGWVLTAGTIFFCCVLGALRAIAHRWPLSTSKNAIRSRRSPSYSVAFRKYLLLPALYGRKYSEKPALFGFTWSIPTRMQSILLFLYLGANVIATAINYRVFPENFYWPNSVPDQLWRYVSDRTGVLSFANLPLMILFAGRNNFLIWITGSSFATFTVFHKWIGRIMVAHAVIHSIGYTHILIADLKEEYLEPYLQYGAVATVAGCLMLFQAMHIFRQKQYEIFLILHIALAICWMVGCYYHVHLINFTQYVPWITASVVIWGFDRFVRLVRIAFYNFSWNGKGLKISHARIERQEALGLVRIEIHPARAWNVKTGQYLFLHILGGLKQRPWESHPFTVVSAFQPSILSQSNSETSSTEGEKSRSGSATDLRPSKESPAYVLFLKPQGGLTKRLAGTLQLNAPVERKVLVEGPYGSSFTLTRYDHTIAIAGGSGLSGILSSVELLASDRPEERNNIRFVWIVRGADQLVGLSQRLAHFAQNRLNVFIYITGHQSTNESEKANSPAAHAALSDLLNAGAQIFYNRPACRELIADARHQFGSMAVVACGPASLMDDCRAAVVNLTSTKEDHIAFFPEYFDW